VALSGDLIRAYRSALSGLIPTGIAWRRDQESVIQRLLYAYAVEVTRFDIRSRELLAESDPRTALELLDEWERYVGLPSPCTGPLEDLYARRAAIVAKLTREPSASIPFLEQFAATLGYVVDIVEFGSARMGASGCGDRLSNVQPGCRMGSSGCGDRLENAFGWAFAWAVRSNGAQTTYARMGSAGAGDRLRAVDNALLECSLREIKPAHTTLLFFYFTAVDPSPVRVVIGVPSVN
jgi:uncharacterized protein YmfQ (DUF2313 family)